MDEPLYEQAACGLLTTDASGTIIAVNQTLLRWLGVDREQLIRRRTFADLLTGGGRIYHETHYAPMLSMQGSAREIAFDLACADGRRLPVLVNARRDQASDGTPVVHVAVFDATERRMYERELLAAKQRAEQSEAHARVLARTLQGTLLPRRVPNVPGLEIAAVYLPAGAGHEIGGDFYDIFQVGGDDWVIALGDVEGKGVDAAVVTALVRYTIRAAAVEHEPSGMLRIVNEVLLGDESSERFCTAVVLRCRRALGRWRITIACGGHPLPAHTHDGHVELVGRPGTLLGLFADVEFHDVEIVLERSDLLFAYTDGISEARRGVKQFGEDNVLALVERMSDLPVDAIVDNMIAAVIEFGGTPNEDDVAAIAVRTSDNAT